MSDIEYSVITSDVIKSFDCIWASVRENLSSGFAYNKGTYQPVHLHRLIVPLIFTCRKVPYLNLLQAKFQFSR